MNRVSSSVSTNTHIHQLSQRGIRVDEDAFHDDRAPGDDRFARVLAGVPRKIVDRGFDRPPGPQIIMWRTIRSVSSESGWS